jgi:transcriptional regulatory protein RtcR
MKKVVIGFLGTRLDAIKGAKRWEHWRPTLALFGHESDFKADRLELIVTKSEQLKLASDVSADIHSVSPDAEVSTHLIPMTDPWDFQEVYGKLHDYFKSYNFDSDTEYYVHLTTGTHVSQICLFLLTESRRLPAKLVETFTHRTEQEPWRGRLEVIDLNLSAYNQLAQRFKRESLDSQDLLKNGIATRNAAFNALIGKIERVALRSSAPLLLTGPTGAGKSQLASRIFALRQKRHQVAGAFIEVNCATLRGDNAMSTLFGHKKGAYTGATTDRAGLLKAADKGILFLDEIGELGSDEQAMLLRALEDKRFTALGADKESESNFQLIAGTNKNLTEEVREGRFRGDLLARINVWHFQLPGLAERIEDLEPNLDFELERISAEENTLITLTTEARAAYLAFGSNAPWVGNFRDLSASVIRMSTLCENGRIQVSDVAAECEALSRAWGTRNTRHCPQSTESLLERVLGDRAKNMDSFEQVQLQHVLEIIMATSSLAEAGRQLFSASRQAKANPNDSDRIRKYLSRWGLDYSSLRAQLQ